MVRAKGELAKAAKGGNGKEGDNADTDGQDVKVQKVDHNKKQATHRDGEEEKPSRKGEAQHDSKKDAKREGKAGGTRKRETKKKVKDEGDVKKEEEEEEDEGEAMDEDEDEGEKTYEKVVEILTNELSIEEVREMLEMNGQDSSGPDEEVIERCADQLVFGPLDKCPMCGGSLEYARTHYRCLGFISPWSKCNYTTTEAAWKGEPWKLPEGIKNKFLQELARTDPKKRPERKLKDLEKPFSGMLIALSGRLTKPQHVWKQEIDKYGGKTSPKIRPDLTCVVAGKNDAEGGGTEKVAEAIDMGLPVVKEYWLIDSIEQKKAMPFEDYDLRADLPAILGVPPEKLDLPGDVPLPLMEELKLAGKRSVHKDSELQDEGGKILERDNIIFNCCFTLCDQTLDMNEYAVHQLVEMPTGEIYLYYKTGRTGRRLPKVERCDEMRNAKHATREFVKIFEDLTGNPFDPWEREKKFEKKVMKFSPADMYIGVEVRAGALRVRQVGPAALHCKLDPRIKSYLKILFNEETYRFCMDEMAINPPDCPVGNVTDFHIARCTDCLLEFVEYMKQAEAEGKKDFKHVQKCLDYSNRWCNLVPSLHPFVAKSLEDIVEILAPTLESVRDISIASQVIGDMTGATLDDPMGDGYKRLGCVMTPLKRSGHIYKTIVKYLANTFEPIKCQDGAFGVVLEDVVQIDAESPAVPTLKELEDIPNKVLLWCGARTCNMVRWLKYGPPCSMFDAPAPGYMFGRGYYCYDSSAKAAQYGFTAVDRPEGMLVLAVVALGDKVVEQAMPEADVRKYEKEKVAVKAIGKKQPDLSGSQTLKLDDNVEVTVPMGNLQEVKDAADSPLDYSEYISTLR